MRFNEVDIEVKHSGLLEVPAGKEVDQLPQSHFQKLIDKKGYEAIIRGLTNLEVWNKNKNPKLSQWASNMADKLKVANKKNESYSTKLDEVNAKLAKKISDKALPFLKKAGDKSKEAIKRAGVTAQNAIVAGAAAPIGVKIANSYNKPKKKEQKYSASDVAAIAAALKKNESLSQKLISHLNLLEKKETKPEESGLKKVAKGAAKGAGVGLATGTAGGALLGHAIGSAVTGGLKGKVAGGLVGAAAKGVRALTTGIGATGGAALGVTRGAAGGALMAGGKHLYDKHQANKKEIKKKNESLIEALDRLKIMYEAEGIGGDNPKPRKKRQLTPEQKARRQERRRIRRQLQKQGAYVPKRKGGKVTTYQGAQKLDPEAVAKAKETLKNNSANINTNSSQKIKIDVDRPKIAKPANNNANTIDKLDKAVKSTSNKMSKANKVFKKPQTYRKLVNKAGKIGGIKGAAIAAGVGAAGLAAKKLYDKNKKKK